MVCVLSALTMCSFIFLLPHSSLPTGIVISASSTSAAISLLPLIWIFEAISVALHVKAFTVESPLIQTLLVGSREIWLPIPTSAASSTIVFIVSPLGELHMEDRRFAGHSLSAIG